VLLASDPVRARALVCEAAAFPFARESAWLTAELERLEHDLEYAPIRFGPKGELIIDVSDSFPTLAQAREATDRYVLGEAIARSGGNIAAAGRLVGESRYNAWYMWKVISGEM